MNDVGSVGDRQPCHEDDGVTRSEKRARRVTSSVTGLSGVIQTVNSKTGDILSRVNEVAQVIGHSRHHK